MLKTSFVKIYIHRLLNQIAPGWVGSGVGSCWVISTQRVGLVGRAQVKPNPSCNPIRVSCIIGRIGLVGKVTKLRIAGKQNDIKVKRK